MRNRVRDWRAARLGQRAKLLSVLPLARIITYAPWSRPFALPFIYEIIPPICTWSFLGRMMHTRTAANFVLNVRPPRGDAP